MIFGSNPTYVYGEIYKDKFSTAEKAYPMQPLPVSCTECPAKIVDGEVQFFFAGPIFNTYVESVEDCVSVLRSYDGKLTVIKSLQPRHQLLTVRTVREDARVREVELYKYDGVFPGLRTTGRVELVGGRNVLHAGRLSGPIVLQNNVQRPETKAVLYEIANGEYSFAEIDNPVERCTVRVEKDLNPVKVVSNGNVRGVLVESRSTQTNIAVYAKRVCLGRYVFIEDINEGPATVRLLGKENGVYRVEFRGFVGECVSPNVSSRMRGVIYDIEGSSFKFRREAESPVGTGTVAETGAEKLEQGGSKKAKIAAEQTPSKEEKAALNEIEAKIEKGENAIPLFKKHIALLACRDALCLRYLKHLERTGMTSREEVFWTLGKASPEFYDFAVAAAESPEMLALLMKKRKSAVCFAKLLSVAPAKEPLARAYPEFIDLIVEDAYRSAEAPYKKVEALVGNSFRGWLAWLKAEDGETKRALFERAVAIKFTRREIKLLFKMWLEFEEKVGGDTEHVKTMAKEYVANQQQ